MADIVNCRSRKPVLHALQQQTTTLDIDLTCNLERFNKRTRIAQPAVLGGYSLGRVPRIIISKANFRENIVKSNVKCSSGC